MRPMVTRFVPGRYQPYSAATRLHLAALREAQMQKDAVRAYELVYAALGA